MARSIHTLWVTHWLEQSATGDTTLSRAAARDGLGEMDTYLARPAEFAAWLEQEGRA